MPKRATIFVLILTAFVRMGLAQASPEKPQEVGVCEIVKELERFNGKMITVRVLEMARPAHSQQRGYA